MGAYWKTPDGSGEAMNVGWYSDVDNRYLGTENPYASSGFNNADAAWSALRLAGGNGRPEGMGHDWNDPTAAMSSVLDAYGKNPNYAKAGITKEMLNPWVNEQAQGWQKELQNRQHSIGEEGGFWGGLSNFMNSPGAVLAVGGGLLGASGAFGDLFSQFGNSNPFSSFSQAWEQPTQVGGVSYGEGAGMDWDPSWADSWSQAGASNAPSLNDYLATLDAADASQGADMLRLAGTDYSGFLKDLATKVGPTAAKSLFERLTSGSLGASDLGKILGAIGPGIGGYLASNSQADAYRDIANRQLNEGQWARDLLKQSYADPNAYLQGEGKAFLDDAAKRQGYALSTGGNPAASGNALTQMMSDAYARNAGALGGYRGGLTSAGYGVPYAAGSNAQLQAVGQQGNAFNALGSIGSGVNNIFNPQPTAAQTLADLLKAAGR